MATRSLIAEIDVPRLSALRVERDNQNGAFGVGAVARSADRNVTPAEDITFQPVEPDPDPPFVFEFDLGQTTEPADPDGGLLGARKLGFCVPPNETLLGYWDRVQDRLYKIRHCMNIDGVVRQLALFQPPIDPMLIVRARAAGLSLEQALDQISAQPPHHRFEVLLEQARRYAATAQQLGGQLLSALERKDEAELTLLRSVHEQEILDLVRRQKEDALREANEALQSLDDQLDVLAAREAYYDDLLASPNSYSAHNAEVNAARYRKDAQEKYDEAASAEASGNKKRQDGPQWSTGPALSTGASAAPPYFIFQTTFEFSATWGSAKEQAKYEGYALDHRDSARKFIASAENASHIAQIELREREWKFQRNVVLKERTVLEQQKVVADIRIDLAEKDLATP